jgi:hypothetical protein
MKNKISLLLWVSILPQLVFIYYVRRNPEWVESYYSEKFYPLVSKLHVGFFNIFSFSAGDLLYFFMIVFSIRYFYKFFTVEVKNPLLIVGDIGALVALISLLFHLTWGINYHRKPLNEQMGMSIEYDQTDLESTLNDLITKSNELHLSLVENDSLAVNFPYSKEELLEKAVSFDPLTNNQLEEIYKVKKSLFSLPLSYMGYSGYLNPITLEAQVNSKIPKISFITTILHETAHQMGYASEKEANFIAFFSAINSEDPYVQYAGYTFAIRYCYGDLLISDREKAIEIIGNLNPGIIKNIRAVNQFWVEYINPLRPFFKKTYDGYLKVNGQKSGIMSYNEMVGMVINHHEKSIKK